MNYWLVKSEPFKYSWQQFEEDGRTFWDGVRNFQARNSLKAMNLDDQVLFYHSNEDRAIVGIAQVVKTAYQDPSTEDPNWVVVDLVPLEKLAKPVTLAQIKADARLENNALVKQSRLSVMPISLEAFEIIVGLGF
ncbi:MAG: EVE domain-containing protein [Verrucomicrobia bacterium]|nr:EVE domain-containing protein [Cytophagales bacterium]